MGDKKASLIIIFISVLIPALVAFLFLKSGVPTQVNFDLAIFPKFHAILNSCTAGLLLLGFYYIKKGEFGSHKFCMFAAFLVSAVFLISYVTYHSLGESVKFGGEGLLRYLYFFILITHIVLAAVQTPFILFTLYNALSNQLQKHKRIARWTLPIWLYVSVTGVLVYFMLKPYY